MQWERKSMPPSCTRRPPCALPARSPRSHACEAPARVLRGPLADFSGLAIQDINAPVCHLLGADVGVSVLARWWGLGSSSQTMFSCRDGGAWRLLGRVTPPHALCLQFREVGR